MSHIFFHPLIRPNLHRFSLRKKRKSKSSYIECHRCNNCLLLTNGALTFSHGFARLFGQRANSIRRTRTHTRLLMVNASLIFHKPCARWTLGFLFNQNIIITCISLKCFVHMKLESESMLEFNVAHSNVQINVSPTISSVVVILFWTHDAKILLLPTANFIQA